VNQACDYLRNDNELLIKPGIVATLVTLYNYLEDSKSAGQILNEAVDRLYKLDQTKGKNSRALAYLIKQNIIYQEKQGNGQRVTEMLEILHKLYPNDTNILSKLIVHYLKSDPERANLLAQKLPSIKQLAEGIDADTIESTFGKRVPKAEKTVEKTKVGDSGSTSATTVASKAAKQKKKRKRKIRLPKKYDPSSKPDPERWLPLRERSYYRGKRGKRGKQTTVGKGTQGAMGSDQSATTTITTSTGAQKSMPASKAAAGGGSASTQPKPTPPPGKSSAGGKRKGKR
jgi:signal recognition particle subunit SRP72